MKKEDVRQVVVEFLNSLSFTDTEKLLVMAKRGEFNFGQCDAETFIDNVVDIYTNICDTTEQVKHGLVKDIKEDLDDYEIY